MAGEWVNLGENGTVSRGQLERFLKLISFVLDEAKGLIDAFPVILDVDKTDADYHPGNNREYGLPGDQASYSLDFSLAGDYRHDKFGIYFQLGEYAGILKSVAEKILLLLSRNIPASTIGKIIFVDYPYGLSSPGAYPGTIYHAFGTGEESWDSQLEQPGGGQTTLINEIHRREPDSIVYLDANGYTTDVPTDKIRVVSILKNSEPDIDGGYIREQGLFGGAATGQKDSGTLLGAVNHKGQWKTDGFRIRKTIDLAI